MRCGPSPSGPQGSVVRPAKRSGTEKMLAHIEEGRDLDECVKEAVRRTKSLARRQASWFGRDPRITWANGPADAEDRLERALEAHDRAR